MVFERIVTEDLMHYSYFVADDGKALVIDPRLDYGVYLELAAKHQVRITGIFETHRNEDICLGSGGLGKASGAQVFISGHEDLPYEYGEKIHDGDEWELSEDLRLKALHTPGHTLGHMSYALYFKDSPYLVFTGDCLFYGGTGRTDFYGKERLEEMTRLQHRSIYEKLKSLGPEVNFFPAHGPGSACGDDMEERPFASLGYELKHSEALAEDPEEFLKKNAVMKYKNPAFHFMEKKNLTPQGLESIALPYGGETEGFKILDLRPREAHQSQYLPRSLQIPSDRISYFLGWFMTQEEPFIIMADGLSPEEVKDCVLTLARQGYRNIKGILTGGTVDELRTSGGAPGHLGWISGGEYRKKGQGKTLDVRRPEELKEEDPVSDRIHIPMQELKGRMAELEDLQGEDLYVLCRSGARATVAASWLKSMAGLNPVVIEGGILAVENSEGEDR